MTLAAGPESIVSIGLFFISLISIAPPSPRIIIRGTSTPVLRTDFSVLFDVSSILGSILAFIAAVFVLLVSPYNFVISDAIVIGIPISSATFATLTSSVISSTPKAIDTTRTSTPKPLSSFILSIIFSFVKFFFLIIVFDIFIILPVPKFISLSATCFFAKYPSMPLPTIPITPT